MSALGHKEILVYDNDGPLDMQNGKSRIHIHFYPFMRSNKFRRT